MSRHEFEHAASLMRGFGLRALMCLAAAAVPASQPDGVRRFQHVVALGGYRACAKQ
eukprot:CAMPEP_0115489630 /NCGR_PEP_ID=MMETSP0271-20121206/62122_1 /TAXON_ID=71861 /ORGANISM="Scrippsiella trochoidea, Strain CCMP3099" /LENGTH=55 /DNA_ID=CAMNT_0002917821 /DNA_START=65 /DNA_END=229 /DNA_ORIENTATION=+